LLRGPRSKNSIITGGHEHEQTTGILHGPTGGMDFARLKELVKDLDKQDNV
jgi:hypothetical protein